MRQHLEFIKKNPSALERHFLYRATLSNLENPNIKTQNIDSIEEKEYFVETMNRLKKGVQDSVDQITGEELDELAKLHSIPEFKELHSQIEQAKKDMEFTSKITNKRILTKSNTFGVAIISFVLSGVIAINHINANVMAVLFLVAIASFIAFIIVLLRDLIGENPKTKEKKKEEKLKKMEAEVETWKKRIEELFPGKNLDEVNSILTGFSKKHPILCEQMDFAQLQPVIEKIKRKLCLNLLSF